MTDSRKQLIKQLIEQYIVLHHEVARIRQHDKSDIANKAQLGILFILHKYGSLSVKKLAGMTHTTSGAVSQMVDHLEKQGLAVRLIDEKDRRVVTVSMTEIGKEQFASARDRRLEQMGWVFAGISDEQLGQMVSVQSKLLNNVADGKEKNQ